MATLRFEVKIRNEQHEEINYMISKHRQPGNNVQVA